MAKTCTIQYHFIRQLDQFSVQFHFPSRLPTATHAVKEMFYLFAFTIGSLCTYAYGQRQLILNGDVVPIGTKTYNAGVRSSPDGVSFCGGGLIPPTHVLTVSYCMSFDMRWVAIGSHYRNGSLDGDRIRVLSVMSHPNFSETSDNPNYTNDFAILMLERPSTFKPVKLAAPDDSDFKAGKWATAMGWGSISETDVSYSNELLRVDLQLVSDEACAAKTDALHPSMVCAGGVYNRDSCYGDSGGPLILEGPGTKEDVLIGLVSWGIGDTCGREGFPGIYSRISNARRWIDSILSGSGTCMDF
ncbi:Trypsin [Phytophthora infestans]|uniref:Trypsin n=1 Tax=Phytophthora infestans TaxID=4787 RepID=A0A8S9UWN1_PHYIN|nr:Trypsin [Phytophthora infestans]